MNLTQKRWYVVLYMFIVMAVFSAVIIGFGAFTEARVRANERVAFEKAVIKVLPDLYDPEMSGPEIHETFVDKVSEPSEQTAGAYTLQSNGSVEAYAIPFNGQGFWAPIHGVIGLDSDRQTVLNIEFYEQKETPGLGARIVEPDFKSQFQGKTLGSIPSPIDMIRPGEPAGPSEINAVTGATQTSVRVEKIVNEALTEWKQKMGDS